MIRKNLFLYLTIFITGFFTASCSNTPATPVLPEATISEIINLESTSLETTRQETITMETTVIQTNNPVNTNPLETIINDMKLPHEGQPHGVPLSWDWAQQPRIGKGNDPETFTAMIAWGQLYEDAKGNPAKNTRVQIKDIKAYMLSKSDKQWHLIQRSYMVYGASFLEDFAYNYTKYPDFRIEGDGSISLKTGNGFNVHFWTYTGRSLIEPEDIAGIFTSVQARLIVDNPELPDDRLQARYLLNMGGDYWLNLDATWIFLQTNQDIGMGRFRYVKTDWQSFNMHTLSESEIRQNPPPFD